MIPSIPLALNRRFTRAVAHDDAALRFYLNNAADAEDNGEATLFERVKPFLGPKLQKVVERHAADEVRHGAMLREELRKLGGEPEPVSPELQLVQRMAVAAGSLFHRELTGPADAARVYLLLYAIERRAIERFALLEEALRPVRPALADTFASIADDEHRHLRYCVAVSRALVPDDAEWTRLRDELVSIEERVFTENARHFQLHLVDRVFTRMSAAEKLFWHASRWLVDRTGQTQKILDVGGAAALPGGQKRKPSRRSSSPTNPDSVTVTISPVSSSLANATVFR